MADQAQHQSGFAEVQKGKGKAPDAHDDVSMGEDEDDDEDEEEEGDDAEAEDIEAEEDDDNMEEIDLDNIVAGGRRTRGKIIDFAKAAEEAKDLPQDEEEDDEDYEAPDAEMQG